MIGSYLATLTQSGDFIIDLKLDSKHHSILYLVTDKVYVLYVTCIYVAMGHVIWKKKTNGIHLF